jgi:hypothetical protein
MIFNTEKTLKSDSLNKSLSYYKFSAKLSKLDDNDLNKKNLNKNISSYNTNYKKIISRNQDVKK